MPRSRAIPFHRFNLVAAGITLAAALAISLSLLRAPARLAADTD